MPNASINGHAKFNVGLVAILLITRSRPGPKLVFHYPADPQSYVEQTTHHDSDNSDSDSDEEDPETERYRSLHTIRTNGADGSPQRNSGVYGRSTVSESSATRESLFGYSEDSIEKLLSPGRWCERKKFEVCLNGLTFVGHPIFADQDGNWTPRGPSIPTTATFEPKLDKSHTPSTHQPVENRTFEQVQGITNIPIREARTAGKTMRDLAHVPDSFDSQGYPSLATSMRSNSTMSGVAAEQLTMFHVVLVLSCAAKSERFIFQIYQHIAKKLSKALHYCQNETSYVGIESRRLLALKAKAKLERTPAAALCTQMVDTSELAWALKEVYEKIVVDDIAEIRLNGMEMSLQIPRREDDWKSNGSDHNLHPHSALLLLEEKDALLGIIGRTDTSPLAYFIREHTPTKTLEKHARNLGIPIRVILDLARHLITWRKARLIQPLHSRNIYVVGPDAPLDQLADHVSNYATKFLALPTLPQMLKMLSGRPIRYVMLIQSKDHRGPYLDILAYLVRHRFVVQLKTFGWLQAPPSLNKAAAEQTSTNKNRQPLSVAKLLSPQLHPVDDDSLSVSSERTAIPTSSGSKKLLFSSISARDQTLQSPSNTSNPITDADIFPRIILSPLDPSSKEEAKGLEQIRDSIDDDELRSRFSSLTRYLDGEHAFEEIAAKEGVKRSKADTWLEALLHKGYLATFSSL